MHSHEKTYIASLGFNDPDKKNSTHDLACQYLSKPENVHKILNTFKEKMPKRSQGRRYYSEDKTVCYLRVVSDILKYKLFQEVPIQKGHSAYKTIVGFIDLKIHIMHNFSTEDISIKANESEFLEIKDMSMEEVIILKNPVIEKSDDTMNSYFNIEVKITNPGISNIIRQIKFYKEFQDHIRQEYYIVATAFPINDEEKTILENEDIGHILLGNKFEEYCSSLSSNKAEGLIEV